MTEQTSLTAKSWMPVTGYDQLAKRGRESAEALRRTEAEARRNAVDTGKELATAAVVGQAALLSRALPDVVTEKALDGAKKSVEVAGTVKDIAASVTDIDGNVTRVIGWATHGLKMWALMSIALTAVILGVVILVAKSRTVKTITSTAIPVVSTVRSLSTKQVTPSPPATT